MQNNDDIIPFTIDYRKEVIKFSKEFNGKKKMSLKEFAISFLKIEPISTEIIAMYIGKKSIDSYKNKYQFIDVKRTPKGIKGKLKIEQA